MIEGFGDAGLSLALSAVGSAMGTGAAAMAAVGSWKKAFLKNKSAPFTMVVFVGAPLSQTIYGFILRNQIIGAQLPATAPSYILQLIMGLAAG
ncbi:MAG: V-type ATP synthase subunit K, partial [Elusimicrobiota bacterium]